jgi:hypothetical protein
MHEGAAQERFLRALLGVLAASALAYPLLLCALQLGFAHLGSAQLPRVDRVAVGMWLAVAVGLCVALIGAVRWGAARRVLSPWLLLGVALPVLYELWLVWPLVA